MHFILPGNCCTCLGWYHHPSSGAHTTVSTASGICHTVTAICRYTHTHTHYRNDRLHLTHFLVAFAKLQKVTVSLVTSVRLSAWNNSAPTGRIFMKFDIWVYFENMSGELQASLKPYKNDRYFTWRSVCIFGHISLSSY
jgi:hypothetical protein